MCRALPLVVHMRHIRQIQRMFFQHNLFEHSLFSKLKLKKKIKNPQHKCLSISPSIKSHHGLGCRQFETQKTHRNPTRLEWPVRKNLIAQSREQKFEVSSGENSKFRVKEKKRKNEQKYINKQKAYNRKHEMKRYTKRKRPREKQRKKNSNN